MALITVVDPRAQIDQILNPEGPPAGGIAGKTVGIRLDSFWQSWDWVAQRWAELLQADGAAVRVWRESSPVGENAALSNTELAEFLDGLDAVIVGLCNCGGCTMWTIHDTLAALERGLPTVCVSTEAFADLAATLARRGGRNQIRLKLLPFPLEGQSQRDVEAIAVEHYPDMLATMGATVG